MGVTANGDRGAAPVTHVQQLIEDTLQRLAKRETLLNYEAQLLCKDGSVRLAVSLSPQALGQFEQQFPGAEVRAH